MITPAANPLDRALTARSLYFDQGKVPDGLIDTAILRSWERCTSAARSERENIAFSPLTNSGVTELLEGNFQLLKAAAEPIEDLVRAVAGAGYAVLLTDGRGFALSISGVPAQASRTMRQAFRLGVDLSESVIGTSAMACATKERRAVRVFGPEHFFSANNSFHCAAAPIIAPDGRVLGAVDITRDTPKPDFGALALVSQCAHAVERRLFRQLRAALVVELAWTSDPHGAQPDWTFAFGPDGEILGMSEGARLAIGSPSLVPPIPFEEIFEGRFAEFVARMAETAGPAPIRFCSGVSVVAHPVDIGLDAGYVGSRPITAAVGSAVKPRAARAPENGNDAAPEFGDPEIARQVTRASKALAHRLPVLILGETGVGKEVVARLLHARSTRSDGPFIAINCAAIPESLIEGELFGHSEGAFTGARKGGSSGRIEEAHDGTLFLDEIGDMAPQLQSRLLRVLETGEVARLGSGRSRSVNFQLICATLRPLQHLVRSGLFREDLLYRIDGYRMEVPALRDRPNVARLVARLLDEISQGTRDLAPAAAALLSRHPWPGNVRELRLCLTRAHSLAEPGELLDVRDFPTLANEPTSGTPEDDHELALPTTPHHMDDPAPGLLSTLETQAIRRALAATDNNVVKAARLLGISRATMYRRMKAIGGR